jgi:microcystin-dependent protein
MDYTLSPDHITDAGTGHSLHSDTAAVPTEVTAKDVNSVIWSLMEIVLAAGRTPQQFDPAVPATYKVLVNSLKDMFVSPTQLAASAVPVGAIIDWPSETVPTGWLECDGSSLPRAGTYAPLFAILGTAHGAVDGAHFNLPDHRGKFKRGWAHGSGADPDRGARGAAAPGGASGDHVGSVQGWQVEAHRHAVSFGGSGQGHGGDTPVVAQLSSTTLTDFTGGNQTNPTNAAVMSIMKVS